MQQLTGKRILLGICGGIAAYKSAELTRAYKRAGAEVIVVMTKAAQAFITPLTLQALSGNPVRTSLLDPEAEAGMGHIELARWADLIVIAPASADTLARLCAGMADDLLTTLCLASPAPLAVAPAMNQQMWRHSATEQNIATLRARGTLIWGPAEGEQACGDTGPGRMLEAEQLAQLSAECFAPKVLEGKRVFITAGPTREAIDPVRYISNHSSGKMGYAIAEAAASAGAEVTLISGPVNLEPPQGVSRIDINSTEEMLQAALEHIEQCDIFIGCAAVADFRPAQVSEQKMKKGSSDDMQLHLTKNPDIIATVAAHPKRPFTVGFAAETQDVVNYAKDKLARKNLDLIAANDVSRADIGFNSDSNALTLISHTGVTELAKSGKAQQARTLIEHISALFDSQQATDE